MDHEGDRRGLKHHWQTGCPPRPEKKKRVHCPCKQGRVFVDLGRKKKGKDRGSGRGGRCPGCNAGGQRLMVSQSGKRECFFFREGTEVAIRTG